MNFCFWNLNKKDLSKEISAIADEHKIDVFAFAECNILPALILKALNHLGPHYYYHNKPAGTTRIELFSKFRSQKIFKIIHESDRFIACRIASPLLGENVTLVALHFQSKVNWTSEDQSQETVAIANEIDKIETKQKHLNTIITGDFNMHPFESGLVQTQGFHATMDRNIAKKIERTVANRPYKFFYNPMWSFLGDRSKGKVAGSLYHNSALHINYFWGLYDQVLIRPSLIDIFDDDYLDIITKVGAESLLSQSGQIGSKYSDHLPIKFSLNL